MRPLVLATMILFSSFAIATPPAKTSAKPLPKSHPDAVNGRVFFIEPKDGATVPTTFKVKMGVEGMKVRKAGEALEDRKSGHHHILVDLPAIPQGNVIPTSPKHIHFGQGQTEAEITLPKGEHTLTLQFANGAHDSYGPTLSQMIKVKVK